jgi:hypothetical protein
LEHPKYAIQIYAEPRVPCIAKDTRHDGRGKGVRKISSDGDMKAWREAIGWDAPGASTNVHPHVVFQEPIVGALQYGVSLVCCRGEVAVMECYGMRTRLGGLDVYGAARSNGGPDGNEITYEFPKVCPAEVAEAVLEVASDRDLQGFVNFDIKMREDGRPAFMEANMRLDGGWLKTSQLGKAIDAYYDCAASGQ